MNLINRIISQTKKRVEKIEISPDTGDAFKNRDIINQVKNVQKDGKVPIIAEVKPSSPSGLKRDISPIEAADIAKEMVKGGAAAISVLTEPFFFNGSMENLESVRNAVEIPVLRKDFIIDERQILETNSDMILLITRVLDDKLKKFVDLSFLRGLEPLVEVHNKKELFEALKTNTNIIGINNRNLKTLKIDLETVKKLAKKIKKKIIVAESGYSTKDGLKDIKGKVNAVLIGSAIMKAENIKQKVDELL